MTKIKNIKFIGEDGEEYTLSSKEKLFCEKCLEFKGNGTEAVLAAGLKTKNRRSAAVMASRMLSKPHISQFFKLILKERKLRSDEVNKAIGELFFLICQRVDLKAKLRAIKLYNKLTGRYRGR